MRIQPFLTLGLLFMTVALALSAHAQDRYGLTVDGAGVVKRDGKPFRGIGVNYFDAFSRTLANTDDTGYEAGFQKLEQAHIPFCRILGGGFWPHDQKLYEENKEEFFRRFDRVVRSAEAHHIGLIPSLFWNPAAVPDLVSEPVSDWGEKTSRTQAYMRRYVRDMVMRYHDSPAIWGWEFGNEYNLGASLPNASEHRPQVAPELGTPRTRSAKDEWSYETIRTAFTAFAKEVRRYDKYRLIATGDGFPRESAWHNWKEHNWVKDTPEQWGEMLHDDNPAPIDVVTVHAYENGAALIRTAAALCRKWKRPLFVGEFGASGPQPKSEKEFTALLKVIEEERVPLAALWVYDFQGQDDTWNVTGQNERAYQLRAVSDANVRIQQP